MLPNPAPARATVALLVAFFVAGTAGLLTLSNRSAPVPVQSAPRPPAGWYFLTSQWQADARTLVAALEYLVTPEPA